MGQEHDDMMAQWNDRCEEEHAMADEELRTEAQELRVPAIGTRMRTKSQFCGVPVGTECVVDEHYHIGTQLGFMVAWDLSDRPLPKNYREHDGSWAMNCPYLRDGFGLGELKYLEEIEHGTE